MKKSISLIFLFVLLLSAPLFGTDKVDMIVLLDNSVSVLPYYDEIQKSLLRKIVSEHLVPGDSFSLITFADSPEVEISREIRSRDDIDNILKYSSLLQPMGNHTDLIMALRFLYKYSLDLPLNNRKKIVILTDGIHDPSEDSPYFHRSETEVRIEIEKAADDIHRQGWDVTIVELENNSTLPDLQTRTDGGDSPANTAELTDEQRVTTDEQTMKTPGDEETETYELSENVETRLDVIDTVAESIGSKPAVFDSDEEDMAGIALGVPLVSIPEYLGSFSGDLNLPLEIKNRSTQVLLFSISQVMSSSGDILKKTASVEIPPDEVRELEIELLLPEGLSEGEQQVEIQIILVDRERISPDSLILKFFYQPKNGFAGSLDILLDWKIITAVIAVILAIIIIVILKKASSSGAFVVRSADEPVHRKEIEAEPVTILDAQGDTEAVEKKAVEKKAVEKKAVEKKAVEKKAAVQKMHKQHHEDLAVMSILNPDSSDEVHIVKKNRPIHMFVFGQNTKSGVSNVKWLGLGRKRTIGGGTKSFFRIFFVKVPSVIAEIECTGEDFVFYPMNMEYFPELSGPIKALNSRIKVVTPEGQIFFIEFRQWISKLEKLNRLLTMTRHSGTPDLDY